MDRKNLRQAYYAAEPRERRSMPMQVRAASDDDGVHISGYASVTGVPYPVEDWAGQYTETVSRGAFAKALQENDDTRLLVNHDGIPLARTASGTLELREIMDPADDPEQKGQTGLWVNGDLDSSSPLAQEVISAMNRGDLDQMSFAFQVTQGTWNDDFTQRTIDEVRLFDVSVVTYPANPATSVQLDSQRAASAAGLIDHMNDIPDEMRDWMKTRFSMKPDDPEPEKRTGLQAMRLESMRTDSDPREPDPSDRTDTTNVNASSTRRDREPETTKSQGGTMKLSAILAQREKALVAERDGLLAVDKPEDFTTEAETRCKEINAQLPELRKQIKDAEHQEKTDAEIRAASEQPDEPADTKVREPNPVYRKDDRKTSYFRDLAFAHRGDKQALDRLTKSQETRAMDTTAASAGVFAPPQWLVEDYIALARPARVAADLAVSQELPSGVSSINLPKVTVGTIVDVQTGQNTALASQDLKADSVSSGITTIGGQSVISLQLLEQSAIPFDEVILRDLTAAYAGKLDTQFLAGTGTPGLNGVTNVDGLISITDSATALTATELYADIANAIAAIQTKRFLSPTAVLMHPRRWSWLLQQVDSTGRPLVVPNGLAYNQTAVTDGTQAQGQAGTILGLPVYVDPNIPTNLGTGADEDEIIVAKFDDLYLYETAPQFEAFDATYANQASMLYRGLAYSAAIPNRYPESIAVISGTGLAVATS